MAYWALKIVLTPLLHILYRVRREGTHRVPKKGPVILASNHQSFIDSIFLPLVVNRRVTFVAKAEYFESWKTAWFFRAVGMIPLKRDGGSASQGALAAAREVLEQGGALGIYPEGTRSPDGRIYKGHTGIARLAKQTGAPVIPVAQFGTAEVQPIGSRGIKVFRTVSVRMGEPLCWPGSSAAATGSSSDNASLRAFTEEIMEAIRALSGQDRVEFYAKRDRGKFAAPGSEAEPIPPDAPDEAVGAGPIFS
jgi:1-acyl-sn-glycerol-3-phosphate acyltransferase